MVRTTSLLASLINVAILGSTQARELIDPNTRFSNLTLELPPVDFPVLQSDFNHPPDCGELSYNGTGRLQGLKALVTGGDSGIGRAITIAFLREGADVAINYLPEEEVDAQALADFLEPEGLFFERIPGDLLDEEFCTELVNEAHSRLDGLDIVINHAGVSGIITGPDWRPIEEMNSEQLEHIFRVNVFASLHVTRAAVPLLPPGGSVIFTTSGLVSDPIGDAVEYGASKAAIAHMVRTLALQLVPRGIRVNGVAPALAYTPFIAAGGFTTEDIEPAQEAWPLGRLIQPVELSPLYVDLADPYSTYVSGEVFAAMGANPGL